MKVIVKSYKPSGKWYHTEETQIELQTIDDVLDLEEKIKCNYESIRHLSGLKQGFSPYYTYMIELESDNLFMDFIIHSNEFIRSSEVLSEKEKNEKLEECNGTLFKAIEEINRINKKLDAENKELKQYKTLYEKTRNLWNKARMNNYELLDEIKDLKDSLKRTVCQSECYKHKEADKLKQTLTEIKDMCSEMNCESLMQNSWCGNTDFKMGCCEKLFKKQILQKISECEVENA